MRTTFCIIMILFVIAVIISVVSIAEAQSSSPVVAHRRLTHGEVMAEVPTVIQQDLYEKAVKLGLTVYPGIDKEVLIKQCAACFLQDHYVVRQMHSVMGPIVFTVGHPRITMSFPAGDSVSLYARGIPPGVEPVRLEEPLEMSEARQLASQCRERLVSHSRSAPQFELRNSGYHNSNNTFYFGWCTPTQQLSCGTGQYIRIEVQKNDGVIYHVRMRKALPTPKIRFEEIVKTAVGVIPGFKAKHLYLTQKFHAGKGRLVWRYEVPPPPMGSPKDVTMWDANTGELLYSIVLNGGKPTKPYRNPVFYTELTEETKKRNVEELIKQRVTELQQQSSK